MTQIANLYTIGVYDSDEQSFFDLLKSSKINVFCDVRARRGVRGKLYSYVNSKYLQEKLEALNITYLHFKDLAPSKQLRDIQAKHDKQSGIARRKRTHLCRPFIDRYKVDVLQDFNISEFLDHFDEGDHVVLFCVERFPSACHRTLLADKIASETGINVEHLLP